jgi:hypothetical protein
LPVGTAAIDALWHSRALYKTVMWERRKPLIRFSVFCPRPPGNNEIIKPIVWLGTEDLAKIVPLLAILLMALHLVWPLGLPGLRHRRDFWKIAVVMIVAIVVTAAIRR